MELDAAHVERTVAQGHHVAFLADGGHLQAVGHRVAVHHPRVVAAHGEAAGQSREDGVIGGQFRRGLHSVVHLRQVGQPSAHHLSDGLFAQADAQDWFLAGIGTDDVQQQAGLFRDARSR